MKRSRAAIGTALVTSTLTSLALLATVPAAHAAVSAEPLASGLAGPLQMDIDEERLVVAQSFAGLLTEITDEGTETLHGEEGYEIAGVAIEGGDIAFLTTKNLSKKDTKQKAFLKVLDSDGGVSTIANIFAHEKESNPDGGVKYGFRGLTDKCEKKLPHHLQSYKGIVEAHPYGLADAPGGGWYVADAAANTILKVKPNGNVKTVAVLGPQKVKITEKRAEAVEAPKCTVGKKFGFEAVPTDVEVAPDGTLLVSLLPGGPESDVLGKRGKLVIVNPKSGKSEVVAKGFLGATNVAIGDGSVFVAELGGGKITEITEEGRRTYYETDSPAAVEFAYGYVYATEGAMNFQDGGSVVKLMELADRVD